MLSLPSNSQQPTIPPLLRLPLSLLLLLSCCAPISLGILCRTGVETVGGPVANCGRGNQCLNTTSALGHTVYSCDFGGICETILNLRDGCVRDGHHTVCCCSSLDGCNYSIGGEDNSLYIVANLNNESKLLGNAEGKTADLNNPTTAAALHFMNDELESVGNI